MLIWDLYHVASVLEKADSGLYIKCQQRQGNDEAVLDWHFCSLDGVIHDTNIDRQSHYLRSFSKTRAVLGLPVNWRSSGHDSPLSCPPFES